MCERLSAMQEQIGIQEFYIAFAFPEFLVHFAKNSLFLSSQEYFPLPLRKLKFGHYLARTWHFDFWLLLNIPAPLPKIEIWPLLGTLSFDCVETNRCIPHGYSLVERKTKKVFTHWSFMWAPWQATLDNWRCTIGCPHMTHSTSLYY